METKKQQLKKKVENWLDLQEGYNIESLLENEDFKACLIECIVEFNIKETTSQQQTIERLRGENRTLKSLIKSLHIYEHATTYNFELEYKDHHYDADTSFLEAQKELIESEQLLNTTEPIGQ